MCIMKKKIVVDELNASKGNVASISSKDISSGEIKGIDDTNNINVQGNLCFSGTCVTPDLMKRMLDKHFKEDNVYNGNESIIYEDIIDAVSKGVIEKSGSPSGWKTNNGWYGHKLLAIGDNQNAPNGITVNVPADKTVI